MYGIAIGVALLMAQAQPSEPAIVISGPSPIVIPLDGSDLGASQLTLFRPPDLQAVPGAEALTKLVQAADRGDLDAQYRLGLVLVYGAGAQADPAAGVAWLQRAAKGDHARAHVFLGELHSFGVLVSRDATFARLHFRAAARKGNRDGRYWAASSFLDPLEPSLGRRDVEAGLKMMRELAMTGDKAAWSRLGDTYRSGIRNRKTGERLLAPDFSEALRWYEKGAAAGDRTAMFILGDLILARHPAPKPFEKARRWFREAARAGHTNAELRLAEMYELGLGGASDYAKAWAIYRKFEDSGNVGDRWRLGRMYEFGRGVRRDLGKALAFYTHDRGLMPQAEVLRIARSIEAGRGFQRDIAKARAFYCFAVDIPAGAFRGAQLCEGGIGGAVDLREAYSLYFVAAHDGHAGARDGLRRVAGRLDEGTRREVEEEMNGWLSDRD